MVRNISLRCIDSGPRADRLIASPCKPVETPGADTGILIRTTLEIVLKLALAIGPRGEIEESCQALLNALRAAVAKDERAEQAQKHQVLNLSLRRTQAAADELTAREQSIMHFITLGLSNKQIARKLGIGPETVKTHISNILLKLDVRNRAQAAALANSRGLIRPEAANSEFAN